MKKVISVVVLSAIAFSAGAAPYGAPAQGRGRASMAGKMMNATPPQPNQERAGVASKNQISATATLAPETAVVQKSSTKV
ncbi:MAG: hypothetical protein Q4C08_04820, partial [Pseudomonadota bacterium]|nr:hypothetical protein [Pseudomonadota bacterium]